MTERTRGIPFETYVENSLLFTERERALAQEFKDWLPDTLIDCHTHCGLSKDVYEIDDRMYGQLNSTFLQFSLEDSDKVRQAMFEGKNLSRLRFPFPFRGIDIKSANDYLINGVTEPDYVVLCGIPDDPDYTNSMLRTKQFKALKMYHQMFNPHARNIYQFFTPEILSVSEETETPIILHLPRAVTECKDELLEVVRTFPNLKISLAHMGFANVLVPNLEQTYAELAQYPNISMDTSMIASPDVFKTAFNTFGTKRIMFGTDEPLNLLRFVLYDHPTKGQRVVTQYPYHWADKEDHEQYKHLASGAVHVHWESLMAIRSAIGQLYTEPVLAEQVKLDVFYNNAARFFTV